MKRTKALCNRKKKKKERKRKGKKFEANIRGKRWKEGRVINFIKEEKVAGNMEKRKIKRKYIIEIKKEKFKRIQGKGRSPRGILGERGK